MAFAEFRADVTEKWRDGKFNTYARWGGVLWVLVVFFASLLVRIECTASCLLSLYLLLLHYHHLKAALPALLFCVYLRLWPAKKGHHLP